MIAADRTIASGPALRTLLYLDAHILWNRIRTAARNPLRLGLWALFLLVIVSSLQARTMMNDAIRSRPAPPPGAGPFLIFFDPTSWLPVAATFVPGLVLVAFGGFTIGSCRQPLPAFKSAADARFLCGSALAPRLVVLWLVARVILSLSWRIPLMLYVFVVILPASLGLSVSSGAGAFFALLLLTTTAALNLPIFISRQRRIGPNPAVFGWLLVLTGLVAVVVVFAELSAGPILPSAFQAVAASLPPGSSPCTASCAPAGCSSSPGSDTATPPPLTSRTGSIWTSSRRPRATSSLDRPSASPGDAGPDGRGRPGRWDRAADGRGAGGLPLHRRVRQPRLPDVSRPVAGLAPPGHAGK